MINLCANLGRGYGVCCGLIQRCEMRPMVARVTSAVSSFFRSCNQMIDRSCSSVRKWVIDIVPYELAMWIVPRYARPLIVYKMSCGIGNLLEELNRIPALDRDNVIEHASRLVGSQDGGWDICRIVKRIGKIPAEERASVIEQMRILLPSFNSNYYKSVIIKVLGEIPVGERSNFITYIHQNKNWIRDVNINIVVGRIEIIGSIPALDRDSVIQHARQLMIPGMTGYEINHLINAMAKIREEERGSVIQYALAVVNPHSTIFRGWIVQVIGAVPLLERADVMGLAGELFTPRMDVFDKIKLIKNISEVPAAQRAQYVRERRAGVRGGLAHAAQGTNVHENNRDALTRAALELFYRHQGAIPKARLSQAKDAFIYYLDTVHMNEDQRKLAKDALLQPHRSGECYGPLTGGDNFSVNGLMLSGEDLIGRLWIFVSGLSPSEQITAKFGMIRALVKSFEGDQRVCNGGKSQRLVTAVLQGRLEGVNVDIVNIAIATRDATRMFFNIEAHKTIRSLEALLAAADRFCDENPGIERAAFLEQINVYAHWESIV